MQQNQAKQVKPEQLTATVQEARNNLPPGVRVRRVPQQGRALYHYEGCDECRAVAGLLSHHGPYNQDVEARDESGRKVPLWPPAGVA